MGFSLSIFLLKKNNWKNKWRFLQGEVELEVKEDIKGIIKPSMYLQRDERFLYTILSVFIHRQLYRTHIITKEERDYIVILCIIKCRKNVG